MKNALIPISKKQGDQLPNCKHSINRKTFEKMNLMCVRLHLLRLWLVILMAVTTETCTCDNSSPSFSRSLEGPKLIAIPAHLFILHETFDTLPTVQTNERQAEGPDRP